MITNMYLCPCNKYVNISFLSLIDILQPGHLIIIKTTNSFEIAYMNGYLLVIIKLKEWLS